jgi:hypothetical protein
MSEDEQPEAVRRALPERREPPRALGAAIAGLVVVGVLAAGLVVDGRFLARGTPPPGVTLTDLGGVGQFRSLFDAGGGTTRLVLILSPT